MFVPNVTYQKEGGKGENILDLYSRLLQIGIIFFHGEINAESSSLFSAKLMYLKHDKGLQHITVYLNSGGGCVSSTLAMIDCMNTIDMTINIVVTGMAASGASLLLSSATPGYRYATKHSTIMIHQPLGKLGFKQADDITIYSTEIQRLKTLLAEIYHKNSCGKASFKDFYDFMDRDNYLTPKAARDIGLIDDII